MSHSRRFLPHQKHVILSTDYWLGNSVPAWERTFCLEVGGIQWNDFSRLKKSISYFPEVMQWDDSAGKEAFNNAKSRYYAEKFKSPCEIPLPNPDMYIDEVDWDAEVDPELVLELENSSQVKPWKEVVIPLPDIKPTGWILEYEGFRQSAVLTGMVVGDKEGEDHEADDCNNFGIAIRKLPAVDRIAYSLLVPFI